MSHSTVSKRCEILVLCGGRGTRLGSLGEKVPKVLVGIDGEPLLHHILRFNMGQGYSRFVLAIGYKGDMIREACVAANLEVELMFSDSGSEASMLRRIYEAQEYYGERVIVTYGDSLSNLLNDDLLEFHSQHDGSLTIVSAPIQSPFGLINMDNNRVTELTEKPILYYYIGSFLLETRAFSEVTATMLDLPDGQGLVEFFDVLIKKNQVYTLSHEGENVTFNTLDELDAVEDRYLRFHTHFRPSNNIS